MSKRTVSEERKKDPVQALKSLRREYKEQGQGYRRALRVFVARAYVEVLVLRKRPRDRERFYKLANVPKSKQNERCFDALVMMYLAGAKSRSGQQEAWRRARAVSYLHRTLGVAPDKLAVELERRGGIAKVAREAAEKAPRQKKESPKPKVAEKTQVSQDPKNNEGLQSGHSNDQEMRLQTLTPLSVLDELREVRVGRKVRLLVERIEGSPALVRVIKFLGLAL